jgi:hypothetical protein
MSKFKTKVVRLAAVLGCVLTLGVGVLMAAAPAQARAVTPSGVHPAVASAQLLGGSFEAVPVVGDSPYFTIQNYVTNYCLGIQGGSTTIGTDAVVWNCNGNPDQLWRWEGTPNAYNFLHLENGNNQCLGVAGGSTAEGAHLINWNCVNHPDQYWGPLASGPTCRNNTAVPAWEALENNDGWVVGTQGGSSAEGTALVQWNFQAKCNNQYWSV